MENNVVTVFGGTGFIGRQIVRELAKKGYSIKVATRIPEKAYFLRPHGVVGQVVPFACNPNNSQDIAKAIKGSKIVINCIGILYQKRKGDFVQTHSTLPGVIAKACQKEEQNQTMRDIKFIHLSALGVDQCSSQYAKSKLEGEKAVLKNFPKATILRPSIVFGPDDDFFNKFAELSRYLPFLPLIGGGKTKFQPTYVGDVADAVMAICDDNVIAQTGAQKTAQNAAQNSSPKTKPLTKEGAIFELGGPEILNFEELYHRMFKYTGRPRTLLSLPWGLAKIQAFFLSRLPKPLLTCDQVNALKTDSTVNNKAYGYHNLNISPKNLDIILPTYLKSYRSGGRFSDLKHAS